MIEEKKKSYKEIQQEKRALDQRSRMMFKPAKGFQNNPLLKYERNSPCPCKSGKKFKHCHLNVMPAVIPTEAKIKELEEERKKLEAEKAEQQTAEQNP